MRKISFWIVFLLAVALLFFLSFYSLFNFSLKSLFQDSELDLSPVYSNNPSLFSNPDAGYFLKSSLLWTHDESSGRFNFSISEGKIIYGVYPQLNFLQEYDDLNLQIIQGVYSSNYSLSINPYLIAESFEDIPNTTVLHLERGHLYFYVPIDPNISITLSIFNLKSGESFILANNTYFEKSDCVGHNGTFIGDTSPCCSGLSPVYFANGTGVCSLCKYSDGSFKELGIDIPETECMACDGQGSFLLKPQGESCYSGLGSCFGGKCLINSSILI